jgi:ABC-type glutathione transport system ATPase component
MTALELRGLTVDYRLGGGALAWLGGRPARTLRAVDAVDLAIERGTALGLVGESGSGKSTLARAVVGLVEPSAGKILIDGELAPTPRPPELQRRAQMVFQDPTGSLNPALSVRRALSEPIRAHGLAADGRLERRCRELVEMVELPRSALDAHPRQLSGGQRQRVAIARALALEPELLVADEAVSALDVSVQSAVLTLLRRLQRELDLTMLFISHDLAVVRQVCGRIAVMYLGEIVERGSTEEVLGAPRNEYTQALLTAAPRLKPRSLRQPRTC